MTDSRLYAVELFCGAGGMATGFEDAGVEVLFANDIDENSVNTYRANRDGDTVVEQGNIRELTADHIKEAVSEEIEDGAEKLDSLDFIVGGPPCEGFSLAGDRDPDDPRNDLFEHYLRIVDGLRPKVLVMENVKGILSMEDGAVKQELLQQIDSMGYSIDEHWLLNAAEFGVPQKRERVFFVATRDDFCSDGVPEPEPANDLDDAVTVWDAISDLPSLDNGEEKNEYEGPWRTEYQKEMRGDVDSRDPELTHHKATSHQKSTRMRFLLTPPGGEPWDFPDEYEEHRPNSYYSSRHNKLDPTEPSFTVTSHALDEMVHYEDPRIMSVREVARIQSFPDRYVFKGRRSIPHHVDDESQYEQIGNSVPPKLAYHISKHIQEQVF